MHVHLFLFWPVYAHFFITFFLRMKNSNRQIRRFHAYVTNTASHSKISNRKIPVNCLKEKLKTLLHMIVFLKHDQLIQTEGLIENFTHALNFANCYVESRQCQTLYDTCTYPIMHLIPPPPLPLRFAWPLFFISPGCHSRPKRNWKQCLRKILGANKVLRLVHYGWCASGEFMCRYVQTLS